MKHPRAIRTRQLILSVAAQHFDAHGYGDANVNAILAAGNLTKGAIYFHFPSKESITQQLTTDWIYTVTELVTDASGHTSPAQNNSRRSSPPWPKRCGRRQPPRRHETHPRTQRRQRQTPSHAGSTPSATSSTPPSPQAKSPTPSRMFATIMSHTSTSRLSDGVAAVTAQQTGIHTAFVWGGAISLLAVAGLFFIRNPS
ncbi:TetR family transcriptional regulator [Rhodococcus qingshengii]|uniref:TetR family transcriptional regulator n=1 Tax=Rhodococcus qingshengii TaxID=334542 RepID=UPI00287F8C61|nr:TetR family transcriptional regulator [Rhodococcus qingshengii]